jgi:hypothetical protein
MIRTLRNRNSENLALRILDKASKVCDQSQTCSLQSAYGSLSKAAHMQRQRQIGRLLSSTRQFAKSVDSSSQINSSEWPKFQDLEQLSLGTRQALSRAGLLRLTEIQARALEPILNGKDVIARARTGTGKV